MKLLSLIAIGTALVFTNADAQDNTLRRTTFGIRAGVDFTNVYGDYMNAGKMKNDLIPGFNVGLNAEIPLVTEFYLQPGVLFRTRGAKYQQMPGQNYRSTLHLTSLEIPINFVYKPRVGTGHLIAGFGPYVDLGLGGKITYDGNNAPGDTDIKFKRKVTNSDSDDYAYYRRVGAGGNLLFGYEFANRLSFQLNTQLGFTNILAENETASSDDNLKHISFGVSAGYRF